MERCWGCKRYKTGVVLRSTDDRLCPDCFEANELQLREQQQQPAVHHIGPNQITTIKLQPDMAIISNTVVAATAAPNNSTALTSISSASDTAADDSTHSKTRKKQTGRSKTVKNSTSSTVTATTSDCSPMLNSQAPCIGDLPSTQNTSASMSASSHPIDNQFEQLHAVIQQQQEIIEKLQRQLNFVFSFLGITDSLSTQDNPAQQISAWSRSDGPTDPQLLPVN
jgi:hypothetical protein